MRPRQVQLPKTPARRGTIAFLTLLHSVSRNPQTGVDFHGERHRPGAWSDYTDLWPSPEYPLIPVCLELTHGEKPEYPSYGGHKARPMIMVVWQFATREPFLPTDKCAGEWIQIARHSGHGLDWVAHLAPIIRKLLETDERNASYICSDLKPAIGRILKCVEHELRELPREADRLELLDGISTYLGGERAQSQAPLQLRWDWHAYFEERFPDR